MDVYSRVSFWGDMRAWKAVGAAADCREGAERGAWGGRWSHQALRGHNSMCPLGGTCDHSFVQRAPPSAATAAHVLLGPTSGTLFSGGLVQLNHSLGAEGSRSINKCVLLLIRRQLKSICNAYSELRDLMWLIYTRGLHTRVCVGHSRRSCTPDSEIQHRQLALTAVFTASSSMPPPPTCGSCIISPEGLESQ